MQYQEIFRAKTSYLHTLLWNTMIPDFRSGAFVKVHTISDFMVAWRYEISLFVLKTIYLLRCAHSRNISLTLEEKFHISARSCNILYEFKRTPLASKILDNSSIPFTCQTRSADGLRFSRLIEVVGTSDTTSKAAGLPHLVTSSIAPCSYVMLVLSLPWSGLFPFLWTVFFYYV